MTTNRLKKSEYNSVICQHDWDWQTTAQERNEWQSNVERLVQDWFADQGYECPNIEWIDEGDLTSWLKAHHEPKVQFVPDRIYHAAWEGMRKVIGYSLDVSSEDRYDWAVLPVYEGEAEYSHYEDASQALSKIRGN